MTYGVRSGKVNKLYVILKVAADNNWGSISPVNSEESCRMCLQYLAKELAVSQSVYMKTHVQHGLKVVSAINNTSALLCLGLPRRCYW